MVKKQLLKRGWAAQDALMFTQATISVRAQNDKRRALPLEPSPAELPPGQLPKAGIKRRLTVPRTYDPLPTTDAQLALCGAPDTIAEARKRSAEELDPIKSEWARLRAACGMQRQRRLARERTTLRRVRGRHPVRCQAAAHVHAWRAQCGDVGHDRRCRGRSSGACYFRMAAARGRHRRVARA